MSVGESNEVNIFGLEYYYRQCSLSLSIVHQNKCLNTNNTNKENNNNNLRLSYVDIRMQIKESSRDIKKKYQKALAL